MRPLTKLFLILCLAALSIWAIRNLDLRPSLIELLARVADLGLWGPPVAVLIYVLAAVLLLPASLVTLSAGFLFGVFAGTVVMSMGSVLAGATAFCISRYLARDWVAGKIEGKEKFQALDHAVADKGWKIVLLTRLSPAFPFNLMNYVFGLTRISFRDYVVATWLGMLPGTLLYVYLGSLAGSLALENGLRERSSMEWIFYAVGLVAALSVTLYVARLARKVLQEEEIDMEGKGAH